MSIQYEVISPSRGIIEQVFVHAFSYVYEGEVLFEIRTEHGDLIPVSVHASGKVKDIEVEAGDEVIEGMILAFIQEEFSNLRTGSD